MQQSAQHSSSFSPVPRVAHLITGLDIGGAEMALYRLLRAQGAATDSIVVSLLEPGSVAGRITDLGIPVHSLGLGETRNLIKGLGRLNDLIDDFRPVVLQTWLYHADFVGYLAQRKRRGPGPALIWNLRRSSVGRSQLKAATYGLVRLNARISRSGPDQIVCGSVAAYNSHRAIGYAEEKLFTIQNGVDSSEFQPSAKRRSATRARLDLSDDDFVVGMVARFEPIKDHSTFLSAAARMRRQTGQGVFLLAGRGATWQNGALSAEIDRLGLRDSCRLLGEQESIVDAYAAMDLAALSSQGEGFPNVVAEAMAMQVPCVATAVGDAPMIVGDPSMLVAVADHDGMADAWTRVAGLTRSERAELGERARERIVREFSLSAAADRYLDLYSSFAPPTPVAKPG